MKKSKPKLFIASSAESLNIAEAVNVNLDHDFEVTIWTNGTFKLSNNTIDDLVTKASSVDFALFIFTPDDISIIRDQKKLVVRDNVLFELGLFIGAIGKDRSFILKPRDETINLPTDLLGITPADYDANRSDNDLVSATNRACTLIKTEAKEKGCINYASISETKKIKSNPSTYELTDIDFEFLASTLETNNMGPVGLAFHQLCNSVRHIDETLLNIACIKLDRMGLLEKSITEENGYDYYAYKISEYGVDTILNNQERLEKLKAKKENPYDKPLDF